MWDKAKTLNDHKLLDVIRIIAFHGESGRLQMTAGSTQGFFFFKNGRLVDASIGSLTGFQAINAAVSMAEGHFSFEPSVPLPLSSSITPYERTILNQFFGIETLDPECAHHVGVSRMDVVDAAEPNWDTEPTQVVPLPDVAVSQLSQDNPENIGTVETQPAENEVRGLTNEDTRRLEDNIARDIAESEKYKETPVIPGLLSSASRQRAGLYLTIAVTLMGLLALALVQKLSNHRSPSVATQRAPAPATGTEPPAVKQNELAASVGQNLTGEWKIVNTVQKTAYRSFNNLEIGFRLVINQTGSEFTATGEKISENGRSLPASGRTPIQVTGSIEGDRVQATFTEMGAIRKTQGRFVWRIEKTGSALAGTFFSTAARSSGKSAATKDL